MTSLQDLCCDSNLGEKVEYNRQVDEAPNEAEGKDATERSGLKIGTPCLLV
jgi:hypothetical protein